MNYIAITPDAINCAELSARLAGLRDQHVSYLYLRAHSLHADLGQLILSARQHAIMPIIPRALYKRAYAATCAVHTRSAERFEHLNVPGIVRTASCHCAVQACTLLDSGADYVFISPVYRPFSKPGDRRPLIAINTLRMLTRRYGERIVLLGGLTPQRIEELGSLLDADFSVGGISMFFTTGTTHEHASLADIRQ